MTQESNLKKCSRCCSTIMLEFYEKNRKGEYFKTCNNCRHKEKEYREENKEQITEYTQNKKEQFKQYREENKEQIAETSKQYRETHKDNIAATRKEYNETHKEQIVESRKQYNDEHKLERREYCDNNYDKIMARKDAYAAKCRANPLECPKCGKAVTFKYMIARHQLTYTCQTFGLENKPTWDEWEKKRLEQLAAEKL